MISKKLIDPITVEIIRNSMESAVEEMGATITKLAHSLIFAECKDFSVAILTSDAELLALAQYVPPHQGGMKTNLDAVLRITGKNNLFPGDVIMTNDPYLGGLHSQDLTFIAPVFHEKQIIAYVACVAHRTDMGGMSPSSYCPLATEIYQEAIRFPAIKLVEKGKMNEDILRLYLTNVRLPEDQMADTQAQLAALRGCERAVKRIVDKYGVNTFLAAAKEILDVTERRARAEIERIPDGTYRATDYTEHDGFTDRDWKIQVALEIKGSDIYVDFTGTDEQAKGFINCAPFLTTAVTWAALMYWIDPAIPKNQGLYRLFKKIYAPKGTIVNPNFPAPVGACTVDSAGVILDVLLTAFSQAVPEQGVGCWTSTGGSPMFFGTNPETSKPFIHLDIDGLATGGGARSFADGWLVSPLTSSNMRLPNVEIIEQNYPIRYMKRELITDGGGDGKFRGGTGLMAQFEIMAPMEVTVRNLRQRHPPHGTAGGTAGGPTRVSIISDGHESVLPLKAARVPLQKGDIFIIRNCGGGGYGNPKDRDPEMVKSDLKDGLVSLEKARKVYGLTE